MSKPITVKDLLKNCGELIEKGYGDKYVFISDDEEGNGIHPCRYLITTNIEYEDYQECCERAYCDYRQCVMLG